MSKRYSPFFDLISGLLMILLSALFLFRYEMVWTSIYWLFLIALSFSTIAKLIQLDFKNLKTNKSLFFNILTTGAIIVFILSYPSRFIAFFPRIFGIYAFLQGFIFLINYFVYRADDLNNRWIILIEAVITLVFSVMIIANPMEHLISVSYIIGIFLFFHGLTRSYKTLRLLLFNSDALFSLPIPIILAALLPKRALKKIKYMENLEEDKCSDLEVFIYLKDEGFEQFGHMDLSYQGTVYSYGCHDPHQRILLGALGDGVLIKADRDRFVEHGVNYKKTTIVKYGLSLTQEQKKLIEARLSSLEKRTIRFRSDSELAQINQTPEPEVWYLSDLYKNTQAKSYKFLTGKFRTYFVFTTNCVNICDYVLRMEKLELLNLRGILTPGTYLNFLNKEYLSNSGIVTHRYVYKPKND